MFYKKMTMGKNLIMGRRTFESMPSSAFAGRNPFVISSHLLDNDFDVKCFDSIQGMIKYVSITCEEFMVVGGETIYREFLPYVDTMYLTQIDSFSYADAYFPYFNPSDWEITPIFSGREDEIDYEINVYTRKRDMRF